MTDWIITLHDKTIRRFTIKAGQQLSIGRGQDCDITIDNKAVSRRHVSLTFQNGMYFVSDLGSTNGTLVNGKKITVDEPISEEDRIEFGKFTLAPAAGKEDETGAGSSTAVDLDMNDETIFVRAQTTVSSGKTFQPKTDGPHLTVVQGNGQPDKLALHHKSSIKIGKAADCDLIVKGWFIAPAQCYIIKQDKGYCLIPQKSWA
ncbi:MAG TPA: FHA domain-containing protein, partial [Desulfobacterales bacterium]|nr:FHA domain-containing protein [Desulfobacterales bacterium]